MKRVFGLRSWLVVVLVISMISSGVLGYYVWNTFTVSLEIKEPIEILDYPSQWSLYPGETVQFNVTVRNNAPLNYSVVLDFECSDMAYQQKYVAFSDEIYTVVPGQQNLKAWLNVTADAPAANLEVTVTVIRVKSGPQLSNLLINGDFEDGALSGWEVEGVCSVSNFVVHGGSYSAYISDEASDSGISQNLNWPINSGLRFEAWFYPLKVGPLSAIYPCSSFDLTFYYKSSMQFAFFVSYRWCWSQYGYNHSKGVYFAIPSTVQHWNYLSRNLADDVYSYFTGFNFSDIILKSLTVQYHYSMDSPGAFYVDDVRISEW